MVSSHSLPAFVRVGRCALVTEEKNDTMKMNNMADNLQKPNTAKKARAEYKRTHLPNSVQVQKEARHGMQTPS